MLPIKSIMPSRRIFLRSVKDVQRKGMICGLLTCTVHNTTPLSDEDNVLYIARLAAYTTFKCSVGY